LLEVDRPRTLLIATRAAPAGERTDARLALVVDDVVGIAARIARAAVGVGESRQLEASAEIDQDVLERPHVAIGLDDRLPDRVARALGRTDRAVEQRDAVPALEVRRIREDEVGIGDHLGRIRVGVDDARNLVGAVRLLVQYALVAGRYGRQAL